MKILLIAFLLCIVNVANAQLRPEPNESSNYRLLGDTAKHYMGIIYEEWTEEFTNEKYMKAFDKFQIKEWIRYYGFSQIWWIEPNSGKWVNRWMLDHYWKYNLHTILVERIELDSTLSPIRKPIK